MTWWEDVGVGGVRGLESEEVGGCGGWRVRGWRLREWCNGIVKMSSRGTQRGTFKTLQTNRQYSICRHHVLR